MIEPAELIVEMSYVNFIAGGLMDQQSKWTQ